MKFLFALLFLLFVVCQAAQPKIRYINSIPQFGSSSVSAAAPNTALFSNVNPNSVSSYKNLNSGSWNYFASFGKKVSAGSDQYDADNNNWYTVYTAQTAQRRLKNFCLTDGITIAPSAGNVSAVRIVNLAQFNFPINASVVRVSSSGSHSWSNVNYAGATSYSLVPSGTYTFDWDSSNTAKRGIEQSTSNCTSNCGSWPFGARKAYTVYVLPSTTIVTTDATTTSKREMRSRRAIQKTETLTQRLALAEKKNEAAAAVVAPVENVVANENVEEAVEEIEEQAAQ